MTYIYGKISRNFTLSIDELQELQYDKMKSRNASPRRYRAATVFTFQQTFRYRVVTVAAITAGPAWTSMLDCYFINDVVRNDDGHWIILLFVH